VQVVAECPVRRGKMAHESAVKMGHASSPGFYDGLTLQLQRMEDEGFLPVPLADLVFVTDDNARALAHLEASVGPR
jgi:hypothetical protein